MRFLWWNVGSSLLAGCVVIVSMWLSSDFYDPKGACAYDPAPFRFEIFTTETATCYLHPGVFVAYIFYFGLFALPVFLIFSLIGRIAYEDVKQRMSSRSPRSSTD